MNNESKMKSLCNILITQTKKGDCYYSHRPKPLRSYPQILESASDNAGENNFSNLILITKT